MMGELNSNARANSVVKFKKYLLAQLTVYSLFQ